MNRWRMVKIFISLIGLYGLVGFFGVPYLITQILPEKIEETTKGGEFSVASASFNPFTFRLRLQSLAFQTPQSTPLFDLKNFVINLDPVDYLWKGKWVIKEVLFEGPKGTLICDTEGNFNFKWLSLLSSEEKSDEKSSPPNLLIRSFTLKGGIIDYTDRSDGKNYHQIIDPIGFHLENINLKDMSKSNGMMRLYATINEGGFVDLRGQITALEPYRINGSIAVNSGKLYTPWRYFKEKFPIEVADGSVNVGFDFRVNGEDINATELSHLHVKAENLRIISKDEQRNLFSLASLRITEGTVQPLRKIFNAKDLNAEGITLAALRSADGKIDWIDYLEAIKAAFPEDENETKIPWNFQLERVSLDKIGVLWSDNAPVDPYLATIKNLSLRSGVVSSDEKIPLTFTVESDAIRMVRQKDNAAITGVDGVRIEGIAVDRSVRSAHVDKLSLQAPMIALKHLSDGSMDFARYLYLSKTKPEPSKLSPFGYRIEEIELLGGAVSVADELPKKRVELKLDQLNVQVQGWDSNPARKNHIVAATRINQGGTLTLVGDLVRSPLRTNGRVHIKGVDLALMDSYIEPSSYASLRRGILGLNVDYDYTPDKTLAKGTLALNDWVVNDARDNSVLLGWEGIGVTPFTYAYPDNRLKINQLNINGLYANAAIDAKKVMNFATLSKSQRTESNGSSSKPFGLDIIKFTMNNSSATFSDQSLPLPFKTYIHDLEGSVLGISTTKDTTTFVKLRGGVDKYGSAKINGSLNTKAPKDFTDMNVVFDNLELKQYTPYSLQFLGYEIDQGKFFLNLGYKINQGKLLGKNQVTIKQIELGKEQAGGSPWPMRLVVALLEDTNGVIDIDLPVEGDVNKPDFKYGKVVWQVIGNLLTKAVTSPFRFLSSLMGIESDTLSAIEFEPGSAKILPSEQEKIDKIADMLKKRPKLSLEIYGAVANVPDERALKIEKLIHAAVAYDKNGKPASEQALALEVLESMAKEAFGRSKINELRDNLEPKYSEESAFVRHYTEALINELLTLQKVTPEELQALAGKRAIEIANVVRKSPELGQRIVIRSNESVKAGEDGNIPSRLEMIVR